LSVLSAVFYDGYTSDFGINMEQQPLSEDKLAEEDVPLNPFKV
jgi:hypothetical protein